MNKQLNIDVKKLDPNAVFPTQAHSTDAGLDLYANQSLRIPSNSHRAIGTGIAIDIPEGYYGQIEERSGVSLNTPLSIKAGIIDAGYRGEIKIIVRNDSTYIHDIESGFKIAQLIIKKLVPTKLTEVTDFKETTERDTKGFGSSDKS